MPKYVSLVLGAAATMTATPVSTPDAASDFYPVPVQVGGSYGFIDTTGKLVIQPTFGLAQRFSDGLALVVNDDNGKYGFIDRTGKIIIAPQYDHAGDFIDGLAVAFQGGKNGWIDKTGRLVIQFQQVEPNIIDWGRSARD
ncbi:MAG TPA: WG repeat-containing protein [Aggregatilineales bacterium]|nr:WG repeat-containing protein [Aggregatilineales bacterium]